MYDYRNEVIRILQEKFGKSYEWAEDAASRLDLAHYWRKYRASELADNIIAFETCLHLL